MSLLIADSGATKTDWLWFGDEETIRIQTQGLHPATLQLPEDEADLKSQIGSLKPKEIRFFGTGCGNPVNDEKIGRVLKSIFPECKTFLIRSDLEGSGRAFFGEGNGVVVVLGTGAISARIENGKVAEKSAALGYAIGDEGSAADLGRRILKRYYRKNAPDSVLRFIGDRIEDASYADMMNRIYTSPRPNRELASIAGAVLQPTFPDELRELIEDAFSDFITGQLSTLNLTGEEPIVCTGKVVVSHSELLAGVIKRHGYKKTEIRYPVIEAWRSRVALERGSK